MNDAQWYYARQGQRYGPVPQAELCEMARRAEVSPMDLVWRAGMVDWEPAGRVPELFAPGSVPPPLPVQYITPTRPPPIGENAAMRMLLPVGRSGWAIAAGYLGLFSVLMFPAPFAMICGLVAIQDIRQNPHRHGMGRAIFGLVMGGIFSVALLLMILIAVVG